jgi:ribose-phosphate pyrophosphokinase
MIKVTYPNYRETVTETINFHLFSGGEWHVNLEPKMLDNSNIIITARLGCADDIMKLLVLTDALRGLYDNDIELVIPYLPYSRQDRRCVKGDPFSLKIFANIINSQGYSKVTTADPHSSAASLLINNFKEIKQVDIVTKINNSFNYQVLVSPDLGASKKVEEAQAKWKHPVDIIYAVKKRDKLGNIIATEVLCDDLTGLDLLIIDDICDGGRTFIELAKVLKEKGAQTVDLYITHPILARGISPLREAGISTIYTTDSVSSCYTSITHRFF